MCSRCILGLTWSLRHLCTSTAGVWKKKGKKIQNGEKDKLGAVVRTSVELVRRAYRRVGRVIQSKARPRSACAPDEERQSLLHFLISILADVGSPANFPPQEFRYEGKTNLVRQ